jgi:hypothetical protein
VVPAFVYSDTDLSVGSDLWSCTQDPLAVSSAKAYQTITEELARLALGKWLR